MVLKRVGPLSLGKVAGLLYTAIGFLAGILFSLFAILGSAIGTVTGNQGPEAVFGVVFGIGAVVFFPLLYGLIGFLGGLIMAALYNVVAGFVGGVELELE